MNLSSYLVHFNSFYIFFIFNVFVNCVYFLFFYFYDYFFKFYEILFENHILHEKVISIKIIII